MIRKVRVGGVLLGGGTIAVQSMTTTKTSDVEASVAQIVCLQKAGCDIARVAVADEADALALEHIRARVDIPVVADVHFSAKLAVLAVENGADKLRINPGNIGGEAQIALVESALHNAAALERHGVNDIVISVKASDVPLTVRAYTLLRRRCDYPLHVGVTEAGTEEAGIVKSSVGIGALLLEGIGETIRVSLSADPVKEVYAAHNILRACGLERDYVEVVACPTCGRCRYDCIGMAARVNERVRTVKKRLKVAVMGCVVNGPGEARGCDLGIAGGSEYCVIMQKGLPDERVERTAAEQVFFKKLETLLQ